MGGTSQKISSGDCAFGIIHDHSKELLARIETIISDPIQLEPDDSAALECALLVAMLVALDKADLMRAHPSPDVVKEWRDTYFGVFDEFVSQQDWDQQVAKERRSELRKPFNKLMKICKDKY